MKKSWLLLLLAVITILLCMGCDGQSKQKQPYLIMAGELVATTQDFKNFWESYSVPIYANADIGALSEADIRQTKHDAFDQFVITILLKARAEDLGIVISNEELEAEIGKMREEYTDMVFKETLLKAAMPYELWRESLRRRLLMEHVMRVDLYAHGEITPEDVARFGGLSGGRSKASAEEVLERVYRAKAESDFQNWIKELQNWYPVKINEEEMNAVLNE